MNILLTKHERRLADSNTSASHAFLSQNFYKSIKNHLDLLLSEQSLAVKSEDRFSVFFVLVFLLESLLLSELECDLDLLHLCFVRFGDFDRERDEDEWHLDFFDFLCELLFGVLDLPLLFLADLYLSLDADCLSCLRRGDRDRRLEEDDFRRGDADFE